MYSIDFGPFQFPKMICVAYEVVELDWKCEELWLGFMGAFYCHNWNLLWTLYQGGCLWPLWCGRLGEFNILLIPPHIFFYGVKYLNALIECSNLDKKIMSNKVVTCSYPSSCILEVTREEYLTYQSMLMFSWFHTGIWRDALCLERWKTMLKHMKFNETPGFLSISTLGMHCFP